MPSSTSSVQSPKTKVIKRKIKDDYGDIENKYPSASTVSNDTMSTSNDSDKKRRLYDGRKLNKGSAHRKSYSLEIKKRAIVLRDSGLSIEDVAKILDTAKSNVEKWCSIKVLFYYLLDFFSFITFLS